VARAQAVRANGNGHYRIEQRFKAYDERSLRSRSAPPRPVRSEGPRYGPGPAKRGGFSALHGLEQGYGFLWNSPAVGRVELANNGTRWVADSARQIDYWVTVGDKPAAILSHYADATGHTPELPSWAAASGRANFANRTQEELCSSKGVPSPRGPAGSDRERLLPLGVLGRLELPFWRMARSGCNVSELKSMGTELMVSVWPSVSPLSANYGPMLDRGLLISSEQSAPVHVTWPERGVKSWIGVFHLRFHQSRSPRLYLGQVEKNYHKAGIRVFWLDGLRTAHAGQTTGPRA